MCHRLTFISILLICTFSCKKHNSDEVIPEKDRIEEDEDPLVEDQSEGDSIENVSDTVIFYNEGEVERIFYNPENSIDIVYVGESYTTNSLRKSNSTYRANALKLYNYLFKHPPFSQFKTSFNYTIVYAADEENGTAFNYSGIPDGDFNYSKLSEYVNAATGQNGFSENTLILLAINRRDIGGFAANKIAFFPSSLPDVMLHEVGHAFGFLGDEYSFERPLSSFIDVNNPNIDFTSDTSELKWNRYLGLIGYENIGAYEGGSYGDSVIAYHPSINSVMRDANFSTNPTTSFGFNAVGREAIAREIFRLQGETLQFDDFLKIDESNVNSTETEPFHSGVVYSYPFQGRCIRKTPLEFYKED